MKKIQLSLTILCLAVSLSGTLKAQTTPVYQLQNGGFEAPFYQETSNSGSVVPPGFNSFYSASGSLAGLGAAQRCASSTDVRPGSTGTQSVRLYSTSVLGIRANGNVTTGRINAGSTSATNVDNYNYTDYTPTTAYTPANPPKFTQQITGTPDSLRFWAKYAPGSNNTTDKARIRIYVHGTGECRDAPVYPTGKFETDYYYGKAMEEFTKGNGGWNCYQVPFEYTGTNTQKNDNGNYYVLLSMTTNATPGGGSGNADQVWFDDIELIYSAWLSDLRINGVTIEGFMKGLLTYGGPKPTGTPGNYQFPLQPSDFSWTTEVSDVKSVIVSNVPGPAGDADGGYTSILITAEDGITQKEYRVYYFVSLSNNNTIAALGYTLDGVNSIPVLGFTSSQLNHSVTLSDPEEVRVPQIREEDVVLSHPGATIYQINQITSLPSGGATAVAGVIVRAENYTLKTYTLSFSKPISSNSKLNWIKVGGTDIAGFSPTILEYNYDLTGCTSTLPTVTYEKTSAYANVSYTPATLTNLTATLTVTAEDNSQTTYKINFVLKNNNTNITQFRYGTGTTNQITTQTGVFVYVSAYSFTAAPSLLTPTLGCTGATYTRTPAANVFYPDTNYFYVTAQDGMTMQTYKVVIKNTNCFLATGNNSALRYNYNGLTNQNTNINITTTNNGNLNPVTTSVVTLPVGPNVPPELVVYGLAAATTAAPPTYQIKQPANRNDTATVTLTANDGVTQKIYKVPFKATLSTDATLSGIQWNGKSVDGFVPGNTYYSVSLDASVTNVPVVTATPAFQWLPAGNIVITQAADMFGTATIVVTAENGTTTKTYYVEFSVQSPDNAYLSALGYSLGNKNIYVKNFRPTTFTYLENIPYSAPLPKLFGTPMAPTAHDFYFNVDTTSTPWKAEALVISENLQGMKIYTVNFNRVKDTISTLADIKINGEILENFNPELFEYNHELSYTELNAPIVTATPAYEYAHVVIQQINSMEGTVTIHVTAEDKNYTSVYTVHITRELSPVTDIDSIFYTYNNHIYAVKSAGTETTVTLPVETEGIPSITNISLTDNRSSFEITGQPDETNNLTGTIVVTAENETEETYSVIFERTLSGSTLLAGMSYTLGGTSYPIDFHPETLTYYILLPYNNSLIPTVNATAVWKNTIIDNSQQPTTPFGQATILVTSEDDQHNKTYTVIFQKKGDAHLVSLSYSLDGVSYPISDFSPAKFNYNVKLDIGTTAVPQLEYVAEDNTCNIMVNQQNTTNGTSSVTLATWNQDTSLTYTVNFTVTLSTEALLSDLQVNGVTITNFAPNKFNYSEYYPYGTVALPVVTAVAKYPDAWIDTIIQLQQYPGEVLIKVHAGDATINTYKISFSVDPGNNTYLSSIYVYGIPLLKFNKNTYFYEDTVTYGVIQAPVVDAAVEDSTSNYHVEQANVVGDTAIITVTAINGDIALYKVHFVSAKSDNCSLKNIYIDWEPLENFNPYIKDYLVKLPASYVGVPNVYGEPEDSKAKPGYESKPYYVKIIVTAENGNICTYTVTFEKDTFNSVTSFNNEAKIQVYPNPSSSYINFVMDEFDRGYLEIYSMEGKKIDNHNLKDGINTIHVGNLPKGIYFYKIYTDKTMLGTGKFVKN